MSFRNEKDERIGELVKMNSALEVENARLVREVERMRAWCFSLEDELRHIKLVVGESQAFMERLKEAGK